MNDDSLQAIFEPGIGSISTLGPEGTDAWAAAAILDIGRIVLHKTFRDAANACAVGETTHALIPAGYKSAPSGVRQETWVDIHFEMEARLTLSHCWYAPTRLMGLYVRKVSIRSKARAVVLTHPATEVYARRYLPNHHIEYRDSKPKIAEDFVKGNFHACIASVDVMNHLTRNNNIRPVMTFQPTMVWCLYGKAQEPMEGMSVNRSEGRTPTLRR